MKSRFPALASRDFQLFLAGQFISVIGTWMHNTAQPYLAYRITGRPLDLGIIGFATTLPTLLLALPAGVLIEHWDKRKTVIILQVVMSLQAFGLAALALSGRIQIWHITVLAFIFGTASAVEITARQAMLVELAGKQALPSAIALQTTAFNLGRILGPALAAPLLARGGEASVFFVNGLSFVFVIGGLLVARTPFQVPRVAINWRNIFNDLASEFHEGMSFIRGHAVIRTVIVMSTLLGIFGIPLLQQIPALARDVLQTAQDTEALIATRTSQVYALQGVGALAAAFLAAYYNRTRRKGLILLVGQVVFTIALIGMSFTSNLPMALVLIAIIGYGSVTQLVMMNTIIQMGVPDALRGRVFAVYLWALQGVAPIGSLLIGGSAQGWGVQFSMLISALVMLALVGGLHLAYPQVRRASA
ncbi:MAG: MFS transporter [Chloroflexi bacterium]|nr:MFS transporter [Chloroflexota bacterium]